ncbi:MAG TPA: SPOR domain-containing protein [Terriglobales bacterium]|nr:SPOR domain-containing protein [Terriglobales bacterium]
MRTAAERPAAGSSHGAGKSYKWEIGTRTLLGFFFALAVVCALFFTFGYTIGKHAVPATFSLGMQNAAPRKPAGLASVPPTATGVQPPNPAQLGAAENNQTPEGLSPTAATTPAAGGEANPRAAAPAASTSSNPNTGTAANAPPATGLLYQVQVFAGSQNDSNTLSSALQQKGYPARVLAPAESDPAGLYRVLVGPYLTRAEAEAMRSRLTADGYQAVIKN